MVFLPAELTQRAVLFSRHDRVWKIADFGTSAVGTSKKALTTKYGRGTSSYRAPEVVAENSVYNCKADIWSLGCTLFELITKKKAFSGDWEVFKHSISKAKYRFQLNETYPRWETTRYLSAMVSAMLDVSLRDRPSAKELRELLYFATRRLDIHPYELIAFSDNDEYEDTQHGEHTTIKALNCKIGANVELMG